jgi:transcriptional regulator with XRE-family HTH domain
MSLLGSRLRQRRRQMRLLQKDIAGKNRVSFLSKVESGAAQPSLSSLGDWSSKLGVLSADLIGDHLVLDAAKQSILRTEKCHEYLDCLPSSPLTTFLRELSASASSLSTDVPKPPPDSELEYLTAKVLAHRGMLLEAKTIIEGAVTHLSCSPLMRIYHLSLLCRIYSELAKPARQREAQSRLRATLLELDHSELLDSLPDADHLTASDLELLRLSSLVRKGHLL